MTAKTRKPLLLNLTLVAVLLLPLLYVLSYAPVVRCIKANQPEDPYRLFVADGSDLPMYLPVDWLIDKTPLKKPLLWWAGFWGVGADFYLANGVRSGVHFNIQFPLSMPSESP